MSTHKTKMNLFIICFSLFTFIPFSGFSQENQPKFFTSEELASVVVYLVQERVEIITIGNEQFEVWLKETDSGNLKPNLLQQVGTGFFLVNDKELFLVTASHIASKMTTSSFVILRGVNDEPIKLKLTDIIGSNKLNWVFHPEADIAIHRLHPSQNVVQTFLQGRFLPTYLLVDSLLAPSRDTPLTIVGFPLGLGTEHYFSPLTLQTRASSGLLRLSRFDNGLISTFFICEDPSIGGYSGAPCFDISIYKLGAMTTTGGGTKLYGLMHGTITDRTGGKLAAVVPSKFIFDLMK